MATGVFGASPEVSGRPVPRPDAPVPMPSPMKMAPSATERLVKAANLGGEVGFAVADAESGEVLEARLASGIFRRRRH